MEGGGVVDGWTKLKGMKTQDPSLYAFLLSNHIYVPIKWETRK